MADLRLPLTDKNVAALRSNPGGQYLARDTELGGFFVLIGARKRTYMIQADLRTSRRRETIRMKVADAEQTTAREARARAKQLLGAIASGEDPRVVRRGKGPVRTNVVPTLREAWERDPDRPPLTWVRPVHDRGATFALARAAEYAAAGYEATRTALRT